MQTDINDSESQRWHTIAAPEIFAKLGTSPEGLLHSEASQRLSQFRKSQLTTSHRRSAWTRFFLQFHNVLIYVLLVAGVITAILGHYVDSGVIFGVVLANAFIGFVQEGTFPSPRHRRKILEMITWKRR